MDNEDILGIRTFRELELKKELSGSSDETNPSVNYIKNANCNKASLYSVSDSSFTPIRNSNNDCLHASTASLRVDKMSSDLLETNEGPSKDCTLCTNQYYNRKLKKLEIFKDSGKDLKKNRHGMIVNKTRINEQTREEQKSLSF